MKATNELNDDEQRLVAAMKEIATAINNTFDTYRPALFRKYALPESEVKRAIALAMLANTVFADSDVDDVSFSEFLGNDIINELIKRWVRGETDATKRNDDVMVTLTR